MVWRTSRTVGFCGRAETVMVPMRPKARLVRVKNCILSTASDVDLTCL